MNYILCLAGGLAQLTIVKAMAEMGKKIIVVDRDKLAACHKWADISILRSTHDYKGIIEDIKMMDLT